MERKEYDESKVAEVASHFEAILKLIGEDPEREGLLKTPVRAAKALLYATSGYRINPTEVMRQAIFSYNGSQMVIVKDIEFYSLCEHHILPFFGTMSIGYIPDGTMLGLSKLARVVDAYARRLQVQEHLTAQVCREIFTTLPAKGVIVSCTAQHLCMKMRGVEKQESATTTVDYLGSFADDPALRAEFFAAVRN
ncbi:MAG: GTP cyclohydrolase I FolE [Muribaculaceae bacterium]|nr:GTP cyclohydrolase I FolE [Muribaculaceae bacterium]MDE5972057.1 GTP cyclohydrolase I FolE [Muribaculaceae bacterium]MDE6510145.1 GTP cyclohydrolase I FolE [Muribaculaceae bacterium]MDE7144269.1 GTP cyclohydrolase I FolE [Muribaculaceae bacterium]